MIKVDYHTCKNNKNYYKPNEDVILVDEINKIFILLDGVSRDLEGGSYPNPSPALEVSQIFASRIRAYLLGELGKADIDYFSVMKAGIIQANLCIRHYNNDLQHPFLAATVGIVALIRNHSFYYAYIGDCIGAHIVKGRIKIFTDPQTALVHQHKGEFTKEDIRNNICNNILHPYCYGVYNGQSEALNFVKYGSLEIESTDTLILMSDGMEELFSLLDIDSIGSKSCSHLVNIIDINEQAIGKTDDKSIIKIKVI